MVLYGLGQSTADELEIKSNIFFSFYYSNTYPIKRTDALSDITAF
jgi:hypothetical protein